MGPVTENLGAVASGARQLQVRDREGHQQGNVPAQWQVFRDSRLEVPVQAEQFAAVLVEKTDLDSMLAISLRPVEEKTNGHRAVKRRRQLPGDHRIEATSEDVGEPVADLDGFGHHRPIQLHLSHSYRRPQTAVPRH